MPSCLYAGEGFTNIPRWLSLTLVRIAFASFFGSIQKVLLGKELLICTPVLGVYFLDFGSEETIPLVFWDWW